jgi:circadian clock protein KaiB
VVHHHQVFAMTDHEVDGQTHVINVVGELDADSHRALERLVADLLRAGKVRVVVDLSEATFLDSSALSGLVVCARKLRQRGGMLALVTGEAPRQPSERFDMTGTREVLNVCETLDEALALVSGAGAPRESHPDEVRLRLFVNGRSPKARHAIDALEDLRRRLPISADIEVVDISVHPEIAERERLIATPVLVRTAPEPVRRIVGDLTDHAMVLDALDLTPLGRVAR